MLLSGVMKVFYLNGLLGDLISSTSVVDGITSSRLFYYAFSFLIFFDILTFGILDKLLVMLASMGGVRSKLMVGVFLLPIVDDECLYLL